MKNSAVRPMFTVSVISLFNSVCLRSEPMNAKETAHYIQMLSWTVSKTTTFRIVVEYKNHKLIYFTDLEAREWIKRKETVRR